MPDVGMQECVCYKLPQLKKRAGIQPENLRPQTKWLRYPLATDDNLMRGVTEHKNDHIDHYQCVV